MVYMGLSLFIIRRANVYLIVCVLTRITLQQSENENLLQYFQSLMKTFNVKIGTDVLEYIINFAFAITFVRCE